MREVIFDDEAIQKILDSQDETMEEITYDKETGKFSVKFKNVDDDEIKDFKFKFCIPE